MAIVLLDGKPGAGKNYIGGNVFQDIFGYHFYDGDEDLTEDEKGAIKQGKKPSNKMRAQHIDLMIQTTNKLSRTHGKLVITNAFLKNEYRVAFLNNTPPSTLIFVETNPDIRNRRLASRKNHIVSFDFAEKIDSEFEYPNGSYLKIYNNSDGVHDLVEQVACILEEQGLR